MNKLVAEVKLMTSRDHRSPRSGQHMNSRSGTVRSDQAGV